MSCGMTNILKVLCEFIIFLLLLYMIIVLLGKIVKLFARYLKETEKEKRLLILVSLFFILFPIILNAIITHKWYLKFPINSDIDPTDWFAFAGSYIGALGTVVCGWVAYRQNHMMAKQQKILDEQQSQMQQLQGLLAKYQIAPNPFFGSLAFKVFEESSNDFKQEEEKEKAYDLTFGERMPDDLGSCIWLVIKLKMTDIIPISNFRVQRITYEIGEKSYSLIIPESQNEEGHDSFIPGYGGKGLQNHDSIHMLITDKNTFMDNNSIHALFDAVGMFCHYKAFPKAGYDCCRWTFQIYFKNQGGQSSTYLVSYQMHQADYTNGSYMCQPRCRRMKDI